MKTIALVSEKGGCGKSQLAIVLAVAASHDGLPAAIIDIDPQASACKWHDRRPDELPWPKVYDASPARLARALGDAERAGAKLAIIDTPGRAADTSVAAARAADLVIVALQPYVADLETLPGTLTLLALAQPLARGWSRYFTWLRFKRTPPAVIASREQNYTPTRGSISKLNFWSENGDGRERLLGRRVEVGAQVGDAEHRAVVRDQ